MNKLSILIIFINLLKYEFSFSQKQDWPPITLINNVEFFNSDFNNNNAACGFLLKFKKDTFAVTAKHVLLVAKTDSMNSVSFGNSLKQWKMSPKDKPHETVLLDKLLNEDKSESIYPQGFKYIDWLVFSIKENNSKVTPLEIRKDKLRYGEPLYVIGWTYNDIEGEQRIYQYSYFGTNGTNFNMELVNAPVDGKGLSGSPVVDSDGLLVGIVSGGYFDPETGTMISSPCSVTGLLDILTKMNNKE